MRVLVTGAGGFVGSNVVHAAAERGHDTVGLVRRPAPVPDPRAGYVAVDLLDAAAVAAVVASAKPDAIVHCAVLNDHVRIYREQDVAWAAYVDVTRTLANAANDAGALLVYVSSDWVFDGVHPGATEATPPNPVNFYGVLKLASELVTLERAREAAVARIAGVMGLHRARHDLPRGQDAGFGYFVASLVDTLSGGEPFVVWESGEINMRATPSLASHSAGLMLDLAERRLTGIYHCCGAEATTRMELARASAEVFGLDQALLRSGLPDLAALPPAPVPRDTSLDAAATAQALGVTLPAVHELLRRFRLEREAAATTLR